MGSPDRSRSIYSVEQVAAIMADVRDPMVREVAAYTCIWGPVDPKGNRDVIDLRISLLREVIDQADRSSDFGPVARKPRYSRP